MIRKSISTFVTLILLSLVLGLLDTAKAQSDYDPTVQTAALLYDEARTVYLGNLARRDNGVPPLRWNLQLTHASRWFSWDSTENRPSGFCGHQDTQGHWPDYRALAFGYLGSAGAENAFCGYVTPESAIQGWMNSPGHRANLLDPSLREIGLGYYRRSSDGRGYITQGFGNDAVYAPVIIEHEAVSTTSPNVNLYIYDRSTGGGFAGLAAATQMMVSNDAYFSSAAWEPYNANKAWTLASGNGWRDVYVKTRDRFNRSLTVNDTIYLGANIPLNELGAAQMATTQSQVTLYNLNGGTLPQAQFSLGWLADDTLESFEKLWGNGERINDAAAWGGTAYRLYPGDGESFAWVYDTTFIKDRPMVAYFRLKVNNNTSSSEVARISVEGGGTEYGPLSIRGTDFTAPNQYQEFALNFTFNTNPNDVFLIFNFWRSGNADVYVDAVSIFSAPQAITSPLTWSVPGNNYRGQGVWVRYTNGVQFSGISEGITIQPPTHTISGNTGAAGVTLNYTDETAKTATSQTDGSYSLTVSNNWSGSVTPAHPCYTFAPPSQTYTNVTTDQTAQNYTPTINPSAGCANLDVTIGGTFQGNYDVAPQSSLEVTYAGLNTGPARINSTDGADLISSQRVIWGAGFDELMGYPANQLTDEYVFPWYNNKAMSSQLRIGNTGDVAADVDVYIGGTKINTTPYNIAVGGSLRVEYAGINSGPVRVVTTTSGASILATMRVIWGKGYDELMGYPADQLTNEYVFPWYNNKAMRSQLRIGNTGTVDADVDVYIGGTKMNETPYNIAVGGSQRVEYAGINDGPVRVVTATSGASILATMRVIWGAGYDELMGYPANKLTTEYVFPLYSNTSLNTQLRVGNTGTVDAEVDVYLGDTKLNTPVYSIPVGGSLRLDYAGKESGPLRVVTTTPGASILATERLIKGSGYDELMGYPANRLTTEYLFPWYNNKAMISEILIGVP